MSSTVTCADPRVSCPAECSRTGHAACLGIDVAVILVQLVELVAGSALHASRGRQRPCNAARKRRGAPCLPLPSRHIPSCSRAPGHARQHQRPHALARVRTASQGRQARRTRAAAPETSQPRTAARRAPVSAQPHGARRSQRTHLVSGVLVRVQAQAHCMVRLLDLRVRRLLGQAERIIERARLPAARHAAAPKGRSVEEAARLAWGPWSLRWSRARRRCGRLASTRDSPS
jgi:hypothetical protein